MAAADQPPHEHPGRRRGGGDGDGDDEADHPRVVIGHRGGGGIPRQQLLDSGRHFMLLGALVLTWHHHFAGAGGHVLAAFFGLWLLGAALAMLALVARQFPRLASAAAALATALRRYLLGGL